MIETDKKTQKELINKLEGIDGEIENLKIEQAKIDKRTEMIKEELAKVFKIIRGY